MSSIIQSGSNKSPNYITMLYRTIQSAVADIRMFYNNLMGAWSGTFTDGSGQIVTVVNGLIMSVEAPPLPLKLTWDDISNAMFTTVGDYNSAFGSDFTTLTVDGNDQLLSGNSTTFAMPASTFDGNTNLVALEDTASSISSLGDFAFKYCPALTTVSLPLCEDLGGTTGDDGVFFAISGQTITLTIAASRATCNGGNPDGDIVYLAANNTATINYV